MKNLYGELREYSHSDYYGFHMPGHKRNKNLTGVGLPYEIDITEIEGFDDLHHAKGMLKKAQERAAQVFHGEETHFLINGSTVGILSAILGCTRRGDRILMARNCHKSVYHAVYMNELEPEYVYPFFYKEQELNGEINPKDVQDILDRERYLFQSDPDYKDKKAITEKQEVLPGERKKIQAVVITSPTYDGVVSNIEKIAKIVHSYDIPLIVDEAHGAHFGFHTYFPQNANTKGADVVIHSIHKTLPSLTQTALIHMNGNIADRKKIKKYLHILQSSSPSYVLMAGIDSCVHWLKSGNMEQYFDKYVEMLKETREQLKKMRHLQILETENFDYSKIVISVKNTKYFGRELYEILLNKYHLQMEMAAGSYVLAMTSVGDTKEGFQRLIRALSEIDNELEEENYSFGNILNEGKNFSQTSMGLLGLEQISMNDKEGKNLIQASMGLLGLEQIGMNDKEGKNLIQAPMGLLGLEQIDMNDKEGKNLSQSPIGLPRLEQIFTCAEMESMDKIDMQEIRVLPWEQCAGRISMEFAYLYPPGIPLIVPGEKISEEVIALLQKYKDMGFEIEGLNYDRKIKTYR